MILYVYPSTMSSVSLRIGVAKFASKLLAVFTKHVLANALAFVWVSTVGASGTEFGSPIL